MSLHIHLQLLICIILAGPMSWSQYCTYLTRLLTHRHAKMLWSNGSIHSNGFKPIWVGVWGVCTGSKFASVWGRDIFISGSHSPINCMKWIFMDRSPLPGYVEVHHVAGYPILSDPYMFRTPIATPGANRSTSLHHSSYLSFAPPEVTYYLCFCLQCCVDSEYHQLNKLIFFQFIKTIVIKKYI